MDFNELENKYGIEKLKGLADMMIEFMSEAGMKPAKVVLNCQKSIEILQEIMDLSADIEIEEEILEDIISFTDDLKDMIDKYYNRLKGEIK